MKSIAHLGRTIAIVICMSPLLLSGAARAQTAGQFVINGGWGHVIPNSSTSDGARITGPGINTTSSSTTSAQSSDTLAGFVGYYLTDNIGIETFVGIPPRVADNTNGPVAGRTVNPVLHSYAWSPMLIGKYVFGTPSSKVRPFLGAGISYIWFSGTSLTQSYQQALSLAFSRGATPNLPSSVTMSRQFAPVAIAGFNINLNEHWMVSASAVYLPFTATTTVETSLPNGQRITSKQRSHYDTVVPTLTVGYRF